MWPQQGIEATRPAKQPRRSTRVRKRKREVAMGSVEVIVGPLEGAPAGTEDQGGKKRRAEVVVQPTKFKLRADFRQLWGEPSGDNAG